MDFFKNFKRLHTVALALIAMTIIVCAVFGGLRTGIDYAGGTLITINVNKEFEESAITAALKENGVAGARVQTAGDKQTLAEIRLQYSGDAGALASGIQQSVAKTYPGAKVVSTEAVTAAYAGKLFISLLVSVVSACVIGFLYAWARYGLRAGISAGLMPVYALALLIGITGALRLTVNTPFIGAVLLTAACSVYSVFLLFERLKESYQSDPQADKHRRELANAGIRVSVPRLLTLFGVLAVVLVALGVCGGTSLREFALPGIIGLIACAFSSVFLAAPLWVTLQERAERRPAVQKKKDVKKAVKKK